MQATDRLFHISHNDLDGYASQFAVSRVFYNVAFFNGNYHELDYLISVVMKQIKMEILAGKPPLMLLITDVNLDLKTAQNLHKQINKLPVKVQLQLIDHHATGRQCAQQFDWYHLDTQCCATRLTYQWLKPWLNNDTDNYLDELSDLVNVTDLWLQEDPRFCFANLMADMIFDKPLMILDMQNDQRDLFFYQIFRMFEDYQKGLSLQQIERSFYDYRLDFLTNSGVDSAIVADTNTSLEIKFHSLILLHLAKHKPATITIDEHRVALFFRWNGTIFQHVSNRYLDKNPHIDIAIRIGSNARLSIRTQRDNINVGDLSRKYFRGGGHPKAAGGTLNAREIPNLATAIKIIEKTISAANKPAKPPSE